MLLQEKEALLSYRNFLNTREKETQDGDFLPLFPLSLSLSLSLSRSLGQILKVMDGPRGFKFVIGPRVSKENGSLSQGTSDKEV